MELPSDAVRAPLIPPRNNDRVQLAVELVCNAVNAVALLLTGVCYVYAIYLLLGTEGASICQLAPVPTVGEVITALLPFGMAFLTLVNNSALKDREVALPTLLLLQGSWATILAWWLTMCAWGEHDKLLAKICAFTLTAEITIWIMYRFQVLGCLRRTLQELWGARFPEETDADNAA